LKEAIKEKQNPIFMQDAMYVEDAMALSDSLICLTSNEADKQSCPVEATIHDFDA